MAKVIKKKIKIPIGSQDKDLASMFNQMLGTGDINLHIAWPRYKRISGLVETLINIFDSFRKTTFMISIPELEPYRKELEEFCAASRAVWKELFSVDLSDYEWALQLVDTSQKEAFAEIYEKAKKSDLVHTFIVVCDQLAPFKRYIGDENDLKPVFITAMAGVEFTPFPFTRLNIKYVFSMPESQGPIQRLILTVLHKAFNLSYQLWQEVTSPDVDVDEFVDVIMNNIDEVQKRPELSRCRKAFGKVKDSVHLLKQRFNNYYRDFITTKNSTIMMEHFIIDVSKETSADPETMRQFRQIISFYRKVAQQQSINPKVKMLFDKVNESFKELERNTENLVKIRDESDEEEEDDAPVAPESEPEDTELHQAQVANASKSVDELVREIEGKK